MLLRTYGKTIRGWEGVNPCVTLWSDGRVKWSFCVTEGVGGGGQFWAKMVLRNYEFPLRNITMTDILS